MQVLQSRSQHFSICLQLFANFCSQLSLFCTFVYNFNEPYENLEISLLFTLKYFGFIFTWQQENSKLKQQKKATTPAAPAPAATCGCRGLCGNKRFYKTLHSPCLSKSSTANSLDTPNAFFSFFFFFKAAREKNGNFLKRAQVKSCKK